jgi:hypothetical protein
VLSLDPKRFPGLLSGERGKLAIHADWPAYPCGNSWHEALYRLSAFPVGTGFVVVDDIDGAALLAADVQCAKLAEPFHDTNFHIAVWHEDLLELSRKGFVAGVKPAILDEWKRVQVASLLSSVKKQTKNPKGKSIKLQSAFGGRVFDLTSFLAPEPFEDDDLPDAPRMWCIFPSGRIQTTTRSADFVEKELVKLQPDVPALISSRVGRIFEMEYYDTAVREACVELEFQIKGLSNCSFYGDKLINHVCAMPRGKSRNLNSWRVNFRQELRSLFKMVRNPFMHALKDISRAQCLSILVRVQRVRSGLL